MTNDNQDALRCAVGLERGQRSGLWYESSAAAGHLRRLVAENDAKDALLRQAVEALGGVHAGEHQGGVVEAIVAIRQHLEGRA